MTFGPKVPKLNSNRSTALDFTVDRLWLHLSCSPDPTTNSKIPNHNYLRIGIKTRFVYFFFILVLKIVKNGMVNLELVVEQDNFVITNILLLWQSKMGGQSVCTVCWIPTSHGRRARSAK